MHAKQTGFSLHNIRAVYTAIPKAFIIYWVRIWLKKVEADLRRLKAGVWGEGAVFLRESELLRLLPSPPFPEGDSMDFTLGS